MLAWFLYGEKDTKTYRRNTIAFSQWVANQMLVQHLLRFQMDSSGSNTNCWEEVYNMLGDEFTREELQQALLLSGNNTAAKHVIYQWNLLGSIEVLEKGVS